VLRDGYRFAVYQGPPAGALASLTRLLVLFRQEGARVVVGCERYVSSGMPGRTHQPVPQQVIGQVYALADSHGYEVVMQSPADAKRVAPNELLRRLGYYVSRRDVDRPDANDANDAARHAVLVLVTRFATVFEQLLSAQP
jgi:hypothetical protein